jgi:hypothetical protein
MIQQMAMYHWRDQVMILKAMEQCGAVTIAAPIQPLAQ